MNTPRTYLDPADLADEDIAKIPDVDYDPKDRGMVLVTVPPRAYAVTITVAPPAGVAGALLSILGDRFAPVGAPVPLAAGPAGPASAVVNLPRGTYQAQVAGGPSKVFEVTGTGAVNVTF